MGHFESIPKRDTLSVIFEPGIIWQCWSFPDKTYISLDLKLGQKVGSKCLKVVNLLFFEMVNWFKDILEAR